MNENNGKINNTRWVDSSMLILFFAGILFFLFFAGTFNSGYHFVDDHEMLRIHSELETTSFIDTSIHWIKSDFNIRFRPVYFLHRVLEIKIFGDNFFALSFYTGILAALTFYFFYFGARKLNFSVIESLILVLLTFVGSQMAVWWKLGTNESLGMFFFGLSFLFMAKCLEKDKYKLNNILFILFLTLASLCKESFVIVISALVLFKIWNEKIFFQITVKESIKKNILLIIPIGIMFVELWIIKFVVGTNKIGYAGSVSDTRELFRGIWVIMFQAEMILPWMKLLAAILSLFLMSLLLAKLNKSTERKKSAGKFMIAFIFFLLILIPNFLLYAKSGMYERYLLPTTFGFAFFVISMLRITNNKILRWASFFVVFIFVIMFSKTANMSARSFAIEGVKTNQFLSAIMENFKMNSSVVLVTDPIQRYEETWSTRAYLSLHGFSNVYGYPILRDYTSDSRKILRDQWLEWFENKNIKDINNSPDVLAFFDKEDIEPFFNQSGVSQSKYRNILVSDNQYSVYIKN